MDKKFALVLPAGGARAAYQVGVLRYIGKTFPEFQPRIFTGISAGSINACYLAQGDPFNEASENLFRLWSNLMFNDVYGTNFRSIFKMLSHWIYDLFVSKLTRRMLLRSLLDATPLGGTLLTHTQFWKISKALRDRRVLGVSLIATNYHTGMSTIFYDSADPLEPWSREGRCAVRTSIRVRHIMASCSIPLLFSPVRIGDSLYGDGSLRYNFPFSPALKLGATHVLAIGGRPPRTTRPNPPNPDQLSLGFVAGAVLNSIFLDSLDSDYENLIRMNSLATQPWVKQVKPFLIRPSCDLASFSKDYLGEVPFHFRQLLRSTANPDELGNLLSYLLFSKGYLGELIALGERDALSQHAEIEAFVKS